MGKTNLIVADKILAKNEHKISKLKSKRISKSNKRDEKRRIGDLAKRMYNNHSTAIKTAAVTGTLTTLANIKNIQGAANAFGIIGSFGLGGFVGVSAGMGCMALKYAHDKGFFDQAKNFGLSQFKAFKGFAGFGTKQQSSQSESEQADVEMIDKKQATSVVTPVTFQLDTQLQEAANQNRPRRNNVNYNPGAFKF